MALVLSLLAASLFVHIAAALNISFVGTFANVSVNPSGSSTSRSSSFELMLRQQYECSIPGGLPCSDPAVCCGPGQHCCGNPPLGCCDNSEECFLLYGTEGCCPDIAQTCGGAICCQPGGVCCSASPTGCCIPGGVCCKSSIAPCCPAETSCCGDGCCQSGEVCERGECIPANLQTKIARFVYDEQKNGALLRNMCNGMRGQNTVVLKYSGKLTETQKRQKRTAAGCVEGYCRKLINAGTITSDLNSCDEFPFASTDQGGGTLPSLQTAINCIPQSQNSHQGWVLKTMISDSNLQAGDDFVVSIDCDEVLGGIVPRGTVSETGVGGVVYNSTLSDSNGTANYFVVGLGDILGGTFNVVLQVTSGSIASAIVIDNQGDNYTVPYAGILSGHTQQMNFSLVDELMGVGLVTVTTDNTTNLTWTFQGNTVADNSTNGGSNSSTPLSAGLTSVTPGIFWVAVAALFPLTAGNLW